MILWRLLFYGGNATTTGKVKYMTHSRRAEDIMFHRDVNADDCCKIESDIYDSNGVADITFKRHSSDIMYLKNGIVEVQAGVDLARQKM